MNDENDLGNLVDSILKHLLVDVASNMSRFKNPLTFDGKFSTAIATSHNQEKWLKENFNDFDTLVGCVIKEVGLKNPPKVYLKDLGDGGTAGCFVGEDNKVCINLRILANYHRSWLDISGTLCHEFRHAYQYETGMLKAHEVGPFRYFQWDRMTIAHNPRISHDEYLNLPWEIDARDYASKTAEKVAVASGLMGCGGNAYGSEQAYYPGKSRNSGTYGGSAFGNSWGSSTPGQTGSSS